MVFGVVGKLGGGKSLTSVFYMCQWLRQGHLVTSNIKINEDFCSKNKIPLDNFTFLDDFTGLNPWTLPNGDLRGSGGSRRSKIVIDEAGEWCDSYSDARHKGQLSDIASWLRQSDKLGQDVYFIVQFENLLHARLRNIVHRWIVCTDLDKFRFPIVGFPLPKPLRAFCVATTFDAKSNEYISRQYIFKSSMYDAYNTSAFFGESYNSNLSSQKLKESASEVVVKSKNWIFSVVYILLVIYFVKFLKYLFF